MFQAYIDCELDGQDSSGRSSMGSVFNVLIADLPDAYLELGEAWAYVQRHLALPPQLSRLYMEEMKRLDKNQHLVKDPEDSAEAFSSDIQSRFERFLLKVRQLLGYLILLALFMAFVLYVLILR